MDKTDPPESFGAFKPVGHVVIAFRSTGDLQAAVNSLLEQGFAQAALMRYTPQEMAAQADAQAHNAGALASFGQELNIVKAHRAMAENGCSFLVVHAPDDEQVKGVAAVARTMKAVAAQSYGRFVIEELIEQPLDDTPAFESPEPGLQANAPTQLRR